MNGRAVISSNLSETRVIEHALVVGDIARRLVGVPLRHDASRTTECGNAGAGRG